MTPAPVRCSLYVPGDRPDRFAKALATRAGLVVLDLEDAVTDKEPARAAVRSFLLSEEVALERLSIRINSGPDGVADVALLAELAAAGRLPAEVRVPKVGSPADLTGLSGLAGVTVHALVETARGVQALPEIADHPMVVAVGLGEADLRSELGLGSEAALAYCRSRLVLASAAAGLRAPAMSVYPAIRDLTGLAASCRAGRELGLRGRTAIHPSQVPVILHAFAPTPEEVASARATLEALQSAAIRGRGVATTGDGAMVDIAMRHRAEQIIAAADL